MSAAPTTEPKKARARKAPTATAPRKSQPAKGLTPRAVRMLRSRLAADATALYAGTLKDGTVLVDTIPPWERETRAIAGGVQVTRPGMSRRFRFAIHTDGRLHGFTYTKCSEGSECAKAVGTVASPIPSKRKSMPLGEYIAELETKSA